MEDLVSNSLGEPFVCFSEEIGTALKNLKDFNYDRVYRSEMTWKQSAKIKLMFELLFDKYFNDLEKANEDSDIHRAFLDGMSPEYRAETPNAGIVRDFIAGMTDDYFLAQCRKQFIPQIQATLF